MRKILYHRAPFILHKNVKLSYFHDVMEKEIFDSHSKENHFMVQKILNFLIIVHFYTKTENVRFVLFHLKECEPKRILFLS